MTPYDFVHLSFQAIGKEVKGKTKLQKTVYFLAKITGHLDELGYRAHFYGPYSPEVADAVERLRSLNFLEETGSAGRLRNSQGFDLARYDYRLTEEGKQVAQLKAVRFPNTWDSLQEAQGRFEQAGDPGTKGLAIAAKTDFMLGEKEGKANVDELSKLACCFGWSVSEDEVLKGAKFLEALGLVHIKD